MNNHFAPNFLKYSQNNVMQTSKKKFSSGFASESGYPKN